MAQEPDSISLIPIKELLKKHKKFDRELFSKLFHSSVKRDRSSQESSRDLPILLHSDIVRMIKSTAHDFPELVTLSSIGKSFEKRDIDLMIVDARDYLLKRADNDKLTDSIV